MSETTASRPEPIFFGGLNRPLFGWLHRAPAETARDVGVVVCNPFGYEANCTHRTIRQVCGTAAAAGMACLRFDYDGTGDSAGSDTDPDRLQAWIGSIHSAISTIRQKANVERVCLVGIRMGAMLASMAAAERRDIAGLVAIAPIVSGRAYQRELTALQGSHERGNPPNRIDATRAQPSGSTESAAREALGTMISAQTWESIGGASLLFVDALPALNVLILDRDDLPGSRAWASHLEKRGARVEARELPGYTEMMRSPHESVVPAEVVRAACDWLKRLAADSFASRNPRAPTNVTATSGATRAERQWQEGPAGLEGDGPMRERAVHLDPHRRLFGIVTDCPGRLDAPARKCILLLNSGAIHHVGPNRLYVTLARLWASAGHVVLRLDLEGLGDSAAPPGNEEGVVYPDHALQNISQALDWLRLNAPGTEYHLMGLCSGAYHSLKAAAAGIGIQGALMINPLTFFWKAGMTLDYAPHHVIAESSRYRHSLVSRASWSRLYKGEIDLPNVARIVCRRLATSFVSYGRRILSTVGAPLKDDLAKELLSISARSVRMQFVFSATDPGFELLRLQAGTALDRLRKEGRVQVSMINGADHTFTLQSPRSALVGLMTTYIGHPVGSSTT